MKRCNDEAKGINQSITALNQKLLYLEQLRSKGYLTPDAYISQANEINRELTVLKSKRVDAFDSELEHIMSEIKLFKRCLEEIAEPMETFDPKLFKEVVKEITINKQDQISFTLLGDLNFTEQL